MTSINVNGGTVLIRDLTVSGNIEYNLNNGGWVSINNLVDWPVTITNSSASIVGKILFTTDILLTLGTTQYFICSAPRLQFGNASLTSGGTRPIITISGLIGYDGLIQNGTNATSAYNNVVVLNLKLVMLNSSLANNGGWLGRAYFGKQSSNNKIVHCTCDWTGPGNSIGSDCGGVIGGFSENVTLTYCYTYGNTNNLATGGIVGPSSNSVITNQCYSTGSFLDAFGASGGIFARDATNCSAIKCYNTGGGTGGGIYGFIPLLNRCFATNCYSRGAINTFSGGIAVGPPLLGGPLVTVSNCYSSGSMASALPGTAGGIIGRTSGSPTDYIATQCYTSGLSSGPPGVGGGIYDNTNADNLIPGQNNYGEANHGNSGNWIDSNTVGRLAGIGATWFSLAPNTPYILLNFGTSPYIQQNINPVTYSIIQSRSLSAPLTGATIPAIATGYGLFRILQGGHPSITIDPVTGSIITTNTPIGTYSLTIYAEDANPSDGYTTTTVLLTVLIPPPPPVPPVPITPACRFCYSYKPPGPIDICCDPPVCTTNEYLSSISSLAPVTYNSSRTSEQSLLLAQQRDFLQEVNTANIASTVQTTLQTSTIITSTLYGQLLQVRQDRYQPFQPYVPPMIPSSVIQLQMNTVNAGVPHSFFTIMDCKGSQSVTT
jgi:hypothetical protein